MKTFLEEDNLTCARVGMSLLPSIESFEILQMFLISLQRLGNSEVLKGYRADALLNELKPQALELHKGSYKLYSLLEATFEMPPSPMDPNINVDEESLCSIRYYVGQRLYTTKRFEEACRKFGMAANSKADCLERMLAQYMFVKVTKFLEENTGRGTFKGKQIGRVEVESGSIPFSIFRGRLKFHRPEFHTPETRAAFEFAFPSFLQPKPPDPSELEKLRRESGATYVMSQERNNRRFAGDFTLSAGSYFGVCMDGPLEDCLTVVNEIRAYRNPQKSGPVKIFDANDDRIVKDFGIPEDRRHSFLVLIDDVNRFREQCPPEVASKVDWDPSHPPAFLIPYAIEYREIERSIDLREPAVRGWFFKTFRLGDGNVLLKPKGENAVDFYGMLPTLLDPHRGGNTTTNAIGMWMRKAGVNAFVYPSARSDVDVICQDGRVTEFSGWNLVDYRGTKSPEFTDAFADLSPWMTAVMPGVQYSIAPETNLPPRGSWRVIGAIQAHRSLYEEQLAGIKNK